MSHTSVFKFFEKSFLCSFYADFGLVELTLVSELDTHRISLNFQPTFILHITPYCGGCIATALPSIIEKKVNKNSENIKRNTVK